MPIYGNSQPSLLKPILYTPSTLTTVAITAMLYLVQGTVIVWKREQKGYRSPSISKVSAK